MEINKVGAVARIKGGNGYPDLNGTATFTKTKNGVLVTVNAYNLPKDKSIFALHIHEGESCSGDTEDEFKDAKSHYNPKNVPHPYHAGDLPPLFGNDGYAYMSVFTNRFTPEEIIDKVIVIHDNPDDFTTQPSGNSGTKIACGKIEKASL